MFSVFREKCSWKREGRPKTWERSSILFFEKQDPWVDYFICQENCCLRHNLPLMPRDTCRHQKEQNLILPVWPMFAGIFDELRPKSGLKHPPHQRAGDGSSELSACTCCRKPWQAHPGSLRSPFSPNRRVSDMCVWAVGAHAASSSLPPSWMSLCAPASSWCVCNPSAFLQLAVPTYFSLLILCNLPFFFEGTTG